MKHGELLSINRCLSQYHYFNLVVMQLKVLLGVHNAVHKKIQECFVHVSLEVDIVVYFSDCTSQHVEWSK